MAGSITVGASDASIGESVMSSSFVVCVSDALTGGIGSFVGVSVQEETVRGCVTEAAGRAAFFCCSGDSDLAKVVGDDWVSTAAAMGTSASLS